MPPDEEDDWAPLSPEQLTLRPGEGDVPSAPSRPEVVAPMPKRKPKAPDPRAEKLLRELQDRIANTPQSDSIVASVDRHEQRRRRKRQGLRATEPTLAATFVRGSEPAEPKPELTFDRRSDLDPRELEDWFGELPEQEQRRLRETWASERRRFDVSRSDAKRRLRRAAVNGALAFLVTGLLMVMLLGTLWHVPAFVVVGALCGAFAQLCGGERFTYMSFGALGYVVVLGGAMLSNGMLFYGLVLAISLMGVVGMDREMRMSAGCRDD